MATQDVVHPYNGIVFSHKKEGSTDTATTWMNLETVMLSD